MQALCLPAPGYYRLQDLASHLLTAKQQQQLRLLNPSSLILAIFCVYGTYTNA